MFELRPISPTFYAKLLLAKIPKAQKHSFKPSVFFVLLGSAPIKASCKMLVKSTPRDFTSQNSCETVGHKSDVKTTIATSMQVFFFLFLFLFSLICYKICTFLSNVVQFYNPGQEIRKTNSPGYPVKIYLASKT